MAAMHGLGGIPHPLAAAYGSSLGGNYYFILFFPFHTYLDVRLGTDITSNSFSNFGQLRNARLNDWSDVCCSGRSRDPHARPDVSKQRCAACQ